jgi:ubiquinone/menaquinone biosynthesis C-methylase UbiE
MARRNARAAGTDVTPIVGRATQLPAATACRVLHDVPAPDVGLALREVHRVCAPEGALGVLELAGIP